MDANRAPPEGGFGFPGAPQGPEPPKAKLVSPPPAPPPPPRKPSSGWMIAGPVMGFVGIGLRLMLLGTRTTAPTPYQFPYRPIDIPPIPSMGAGIDWTQLSGLSAKAQEPEPLASDGSAVASALGCTVSEAKPEELIMRPLGNAPKPPVALAVSAKYAYAMALESDGKAQIFRAPRAVAATPDAPVEPMTPFAKVTAPSQSPAIVLDRTHAYFLDGGSVVRVPLEGGAHEPVLALPDPVTDFAIDDTSIYAATSAELTKRPKAGGAPKRIWAGGRAANLTLTADEIVWMQHETGNLFAAKKTGAVRVLAAQNVGTRVVGAGPKNAYVLAAEGRWWALFRVPLAGGARSRVPVFLETKPQFAMLRNGSLAYKEARGTTHTVPPLFLDAAP